MSTHARTHSLTHSSLTRGQNPRNSRRLDNLSSFYCSLLVHNFFGAVSRVRGTRCSALSHRPGNRVHSGVSCKIMESQWRLPPSGLFSRQIQNKPINLPFGNWSVLFRSLSPRACFPRLASPLLASALLSSRRLKLNARSSHKTNSVREGGSGAARKPIPSHHTSRSPSALRKIDRKQRAERRARW